QKQSGLDARYILAHAALESGWGRSNIAKRYNNYFGIGAFDNDPNNAKNFSNSGLASGIINGAKWIAKNYYNSSYKQTTLYKMRNNNGVHQYATDPNWHNKIANIMKGSERYTRPAAPTKNKTKEVLETVTENKEVEKETNLKGYKYDDGRYFVDKDGRVCDREANAIWSKPNTKGRYLSRVYESEATSQKTLFDECLNQLKKNNEPEISYDVNPDKIPKEIDIGDRVRIIDHDYSPALYLEARLVDVTTSSTNDYIDRAVFANFVPKTSGIAERLLNLQSNIQDFKYSFENQPYLMSLESSSGNVFKDDIVDTNLIAKLTKAGIDQSANVDGYIWERISKYPDKLVIKDEDWNENHKDFNEHFIELSRSDIELEATFVCSAMLDDLAVATASYTIKNLSIGIYKQKEEPNREILMWGDVWQWEEGETKFKRIWKGDRWEDTVTKRDLELIELTPGPPGRDGKDGMPGKAGADGKTSYMHFAYADSSDGAVGFTLTATNGKKYIGFYTDFEKTDSINPSKYEWSKYVGDDGKPGKDGSQGIPGKAGADGKTPYFHTAWANNSTGTSGFSTSQAGDKAYIGTYTDYTKSDSTDPSKYTWQLVKGNKGDKGEAGKQGVAGPPGRDGKTGKIGQNLLRKSNVPIVDNVEYRSGHWTLCETPETGETMTFTCKIKLEKDDKLMVFNSGGMIELDWWTKLSKSQEYAIYTSTFNWEDKILYNGQTYEQANPPTLRLYTHTNGNGENKNSNKVSIEWATLTRGDIPAIEWSPCYADVDDAISEKASEESLQDLQVHFAMYPTAEELNQNKIDLMKQQAYLDQLKTAIDSNALSLEDRLSIIEVNVGAGKLSLEAINTYLHFGEEGVLIGKEGEQVRLRLINNALEITDGTKVVARFANNQTETPNLKVSGAFEFGYHLANKVDLNGNKFTVISPNI
ncbi:glucosaminidase domain-containing protein, partial [Anaerococcus porci]|uniref:glucosaminidase domain-containing protein n=1 Tax=Anaerococcus porci TaxID=2652269 RepID=UPI002A7491B1